MKKLSISLVVVTLNEEDNIERCLKSVPFADDIVVVDSFSHDRTVEIASSCGARVIQEKWRGFGPQKAFAVSLAKNDWILSLDADEALSDELQAEIISKISTLREDTAYEIPRRSFHLGRWINHGAWYPDYQLRLFNRKTAQWPDATIHERVQAPREGKLSSPILHWVFDDLADQVQTNNKYSTLQAIELDKKSRKFSLFKLIVKPISKFIELYLYKGGFLDGMPGFIIAVGASYSVFLKFAKLWELQKIKKG